MKARIGLVGSIVAAGLYTIVSAQSSGEPTMDATKAWLESDGRDLMRANRLQDDRVNHAITAGSDHVDSIALNDCTLYWRTVESSQTTVVTRAGSRVAPPTVHTTDIVLMLRDLSVGSISVEPDTAFTDAPVYAVRLVIRDPTGATSTRSIDSGNLVAIRQASLPVSTADDGQRIANALKRAAVLCGVTKKGVF